MVIKNIIEGWANYVKDRFDALPDDIKYLSEARLVMCDGCEIRSGGSCDPSKSGKHIVTGETASGCGCHIAAKSMSPSSQCPLGKWETIKMEKNET